MKTKHIIVDIVIAFVLICADLTLYGFASSKELYLADSLNFMCNKHPFNPIPENYIEGKMEELDIDDYSKEMILTDLFINEVQSEDASFLPDSFSNCSLNYFGFGEIRYDTLRNEWPIFIHELYLETTFIDIISFRNEINRICDENQGVFIENNELFELDCYVFVYNLYSFFRYILFDSSNLKIIYISFYAIEFVNNLVFSDEYIPTKTLSEANFPFEPNRKNKTFYCGYDFLYSGIYGI